MAGLKTLVGLAFFGSIGMTLLIVACAVYAKWWPFFVVVFYILAPIPTMLVKRYMEGNANNNSLPMDVGIFITMGLVVSAYALPIILARAPEAAISWSACFLTLSANTVLFLTMVGFFMIFQEDTDMWGF